MIRVLMICGGALLVWIAMSIVAGVWLGSAVEGMEKTRDLVGDDEWKGWE